ncbi:MAG: LVIVD repeat-containing protein, partial [bacterium]
MKNFCSYLICCAFFIAILFPGNYARSQENALPVPTLYTEDSSPVPTLYMENQNSEEEKINFNSITTVGNTLYALAEKTLIPLEPYYMLRAIDFSDPQKPTLIGDIDTDINLEYDPQFHMVISDNYLFSLRGENEESYFSIYEIQNKEELILRKKVSLKSILDSVRKDQKEKFYSFVLTVTDQRAYLIFHAIPSYAPVDYPNPPESEAYYSIPQDDEDQSLTLSTTSGSEVVSPLSPALPSEDNTIIVTIDIQDPSNAQILGVSRLPVPCTGPKDLIVNDTVGYLLAPSNDFRDSNIHVLDLSSSANILVTYSLTIYGEGGQLVREGDYLYIAAQSFGLEIVDIRNPREPSLISWFETPHPQRRMYKGKAGFRNIIVNDGYAYLLDMENGLIVIDISDIAHPDLVSSYISDYTSGSSNFLWDSSYTSIERSGDFLILHDPTDVIEIVSIEDPLSPASVGILGEREPAMLPSASVGILGDREPTMLSLALRLEVAEQLNIDSEEGPEGDIALFGIPSLDALNRKYGVIMIQQPNIDTPYFADLSPSSIKDTEPSVEDIQKDRNLRTFSLTFPGPINLDEIKAEYLKNPYIITAEIDLSEIHGYSSYFGSSYMPIEQTIPYSMQMPVSGVYGGIYGSISGGMYGSSLYGSVGSSPSGGTLYGGMYGM